MPGMRASVQLNRSLPPFRWRSTPLARAQPRCRGAAAAAVACAQLPCWGTAGAAVLGEAWIARKTCLAEGRLLGLGLRQASMRAAISAGHSSGTLHQGRQRGGR